MLYWQLITYSLSRLLIALHTGISIEKYKSNVKTRTRSNLTSYLLCCLQKRNTYCRSRSLSNASFSFFWSRDVHPVQNLLLCNILLQSDDFSLRYGDISQNGDRPLSWNCFATIRDHPRSLCCWPQLPVKFHVNLTHRSDYCQITVQCYAWTEYKFTCVCVCLFVCVSVTLSVNSPTGQTLNRFLQLIA